MNFKDCAWIHEDAKGVFFRDYMWFLSDEDNTIEKGSGAGTDFPNDRAIIFNGRWNFIVHVNDLDHLRVTCMTHYGDLLANYRKLHLILNAFNQHKSLSMYSTHPKYGYVNTWIADLGCALTASVILSLDHTYDENPEAWIKTIESQFHVTTMRVQTIREKKTYMVYATGQFGMTEKDKIEWVWNAALKLIEHEKELEAKHK